MVLYFAPWLHVSALGIGLKQSFIQIAAKGCLVRIADIYVFSSEGLL